MNDQGIDLFNRGSNQSGMRAYNERLVLSLLRRYGAHAKSSIAQMTGLSAQTVSVIMRELEKDGLLKRGERVRGKVGQPSVPMSLSAEGAYFFGLKLGRRSSDLVLINFLGNIVSSIHQTYAYPTPDATIEFTKMAIEKITSQLDSRQISRISGLGIGMPFQLWNWVESIGAPQPVMDAWKTRQIDRELAEILDFPVYLQNDATAACGAELVFGQFSGPRNFLYYYLGYFIGGGVVANGSLFPGKSGNAGALGSMPVPDAQGKIHQLIDVASIYVLEQLVREAGFDTTSLWESPDHWDIDQQILQTWISNAARGIAFSIVSAESVLDFDTIIIDGWLPPSVKDALLDAVRSYLDSFDFTGIEVPDVIGGKIGANARALGAASLPLSLRFMVDQSALLKE